jgi:HD superfamily phosphohydrolase
MAKKIFDPIHGFIDIKTFEEEIISSFPFKRLQAIHQIAAAAFVYNGGNHKRYEHSIGTMMVADKIYHHVMKKSNFFPNLPKKGTKEYNYWRSVLRAAALCHDLGHPPFSHLAEKELLHGERHEQWTKKIIFSEYLTPIWKKENLDPTHIAKISIGRGYFDEPFSEIESILTEMITGDYFGADRIDYLLRDSYFTGLAYGSFDYEQLIQSLSILPYKGRAYLGVEEDGLESCYALLLARYFMHKRLYQYSNIKAYSFHFSRFILKYYQGKNITNSVDDYLKTNDFEILAEVYKAYIDKTHPFHSEALCLMNRQMRYKATPVDDATMNSYKKKFEKEPSWIFFEENSIDKKKKFFSFPVLQKDGMIQGADTISDVHIPVNMSNWVFVSPEHTDFLKHKESDAEEVH